MYIPTHFAIDPAAIDELLDRHGAADLITLTDEGLLATMLPFAYEPAVGQLGAPEQRDERAAEILARAFGDRSRRAALRRSPSTRPNPISCGRSSPPFPVSRRAFSQSSNTIPKPARALWCSTISLLRRYLPPIASGWIRLRTNPRSPCEASRQT